MDTQFFAQLRDCLAQLYPSDGDAVRVAHDTGIDSARVATDESAINRWHAILMEAEKVDAIERLFQIALKEYGRHELLCALYLIHRQQQAHSTLDKTGPVEMLATLPLPHTWPHRHSPRRTGPVEMLTTLPLPHTWPHRHSPRRLVGDRVPERLVIVALLLCFLLFNFGTIRSAAGRVQALIITVIDSNSGKVLTTRMVEAPVISPDNTRMAMVSQDGAVILTDLITGKEITKMYYEMVIINLLFTQDGTRLIIIGDSDTIHIWDSQNGEKLSSLHHDALVTKTSLSADGTHLLVTTADSMTRTWNLENEGYLASVPESERIQSNHAHTTAIQRVAVVAAKEIQPQADATNSFLVAENAVLPQEIFYSPERTHLLSAQRDGTYIRWDNVNAQLVTQLQNNVALTKINLSPDRTRLATVEQWGDAVSLIRLWNNNTGKQLASFSYQVTVTQILFSPNSIYLAVAGDAIERDTGASSTIYIVNSKTGIQVSELRHKTIIDQLLFSPDSSQLATATVEDTVYLWQTSNSSINLQFIHHADIVEMRFRADGSRLVTVVTNGTNNNIYLWDTTTGREVQRFLDIAGVEQVSFTENGAHLIIIAESLIRND